MRQVPRVPQVLRVLPALGALVVSLAIVFAQEPTAPVGAGIREQVRQVTPPRGGPREMPTGTATLRGSVVAADNGSPIRRAQVRISGQGVPPRLASTDAQGRFELRDLPAGRYTLTASKGGFVTLQYGQRRPSESGTPLEIRRCAGAGQSRDRPAARQRNQRPNHRRVRRTRRQRRSSLRCAMAIPAGARRLMPRPGQNSRDTTDDQGQFRLFGLSPGEYVVSAMLRVGGPEATDPAGEATGYAAHLLSRHANLAEAHASTWRSDRSNRASRSR